MHTTNLRKVGGSVMLAGPPALLDILHLQSGANVGIAVESGRLIVEPQRRRRYTLDELLAQSIPRRRALRKSKNGSIVRPSTASSSDEARRNLARQFRSYVGTRAEGPPSGVDRVAGGLQPDNETARDSADHERR
jgi:antitoxin ChpS